MSLSLPPLCTHHNLFKAQKLDRNFNFHQFKIYSNTFKSISKDGMNVKCYYTTKK